MLENLRDFLSNMVNSAGQMPSAYDKSTVFNKMIQDLVKMKME